jgi:hypothetical protein
LSGLERSDKNKGSKEKGEPDHAASPWYRSISALNQAKLLSGLERSDKKYGREPPPAILNSPTDCFENKDNGFKRDKNKFSVSDTVSPYGACG